MLDTIFIVVTVLAWLCISGALICVNDAHTKRHIRDRGLKFCYAGFFFGVVLIVLLIIDTAIKVGQVGGT